MRGMVALLLVPLCFGCDDQNGMKMGSGGSGGGGSGGGGGGPQGPKNDIQIDLSGLDRYVQGAPPTYTVAGRATASAGIDHLLVADQMAALADDGGFHADVPVSPGLSPLPILAFDRAQPQHTRKGDRSLISARFLAEGDMNPGGAALTLSDQMLADAAAPLAQDITNLNVADQVRMRPVLSDDGTCRTVPAAARQMPTQFALTRSSEGKLQVRVTVPQLVVQFTGQCSVLGNGIPLHGQFSTNIVMTSLLDPVAPAAGSCLHQFNHSMPAVQMQNWQFEVHGDGPSGFLVDLLGGSQGPTARDRFQQEFAMQADQLLAMKLADVNLFNKQQTIMMKGVSIDLGLCLTGLLSESSSLRAVVGTRARGPGGAEAPGAPQVDGALPTVEANTLWLDSNLIGQLLFSSWRAGGLSSGSIMQVDVALLALLAPGLMGRYPDGTMADVSTTAELPPFIHAAAPADGDLVIELGDLMVDLKVGSDLLFRLGVNVKLTLELVPQADALMPMVTKVEAKSHLLEAPVADVPDDVIENVINGRVKDAAAMLVGDAAISLPSIGSVVLHPRDVMADPGGRYLKLPLQ
jgi:hypothetical protein